MTVSSKSKLVRWAYLFEERHPRYDPKTRSDIYSNIPSRVSLCGLFWRSVLLTPVLLLIVLAVGGFVVGAIGIIFYRVPMIPVGIAFIAAGGYVLHLLLTKGVMDRIEVFAQPTRSSLLWQGLKAIKSKFCPIIEIDYSEE